jgi:trehalose 6-phosphate phosphatase
VESRAALEAACETLAAVARNWEGSWVEDKRLSATLHYRKADPRCHRALRFAARKALARFGAGFSLRAGNKALEICPRANWDKGSALEYVRRALGPFDLSIAVGDDRTDEAMFRANAGQINVKVGPARPTLAQFHLSDYTETAVFLEHVLDMCAAPALELAAGAGGRTSDGEDVGQA